MSKRKSAFAFVRRQWQEHLPVVLDNTNGWHTCCASKCNIQHIEATICMAGGTAHPYCPETCQGHSPLDRVCVDTLYGCKNTGCIHECEAGNCVVQNGVCTISGKPVMVQDTPLAVSHAPTTNRRGRRRRTASHTNEPRACILLYDLLFSKRRKLYEKQRAETCTDLSRRQIQRLCREAIRSRVPFMVQEAVDIFIRNKEKYRLAPRYLYSSSLCSKSVCKKYAAVTVRVWSAFSHVFSKRITFDAMCAALLYHMRRGIAYGGIYIIPKDSFLFDTLPGTRCPLVPFGVFKSNFPFPCFVLRRCPCHQRRWNQSACLHPRKEHH